MALRWSEEDLAAYRERQGKGGPIPASSPIALQERHNSEVPTEDEEQIDLFRWAAYNAGKYPALRWLYHVPNGGSRGPAEAGRFKAMGVKSGVPDVALDEPRGGFHGLRIEMKRRRGGRLSEEQREWIDHYNQIGYRAVVCYGWDQAREEIEAYLTGGDDRGRPEKSAGADRNQRGTGGEPMKRYW